MGLDSLKYTALTHLFLYKKTCRFDKLSKKKNSYCVKTFDESISKSIKQLKILFKIVCKSSDPP